ncbi:MAG: protoheme IX farnesyltransferase [Anaerolineaceae bacterium]|nr:protoheme IX farnesyltransferase [Anaerolineaceae bacterium]MBN2677738.1 protoheme IX farnesyltransferase [Anaerolineaceae bacterium]
MNAIREKYLPLIKSSQTGLLLLTGLAGYLSSAHPVDWKDLALLTISLFLAISGSTVLNMWYDRDIDAKMKRTCNRPLSAGKLSPGGALRLGLLLSGHGIGFAFSLDPLYGLVVFAGLFFDMVIYTLWLKRRTCWSIIWGGLSGGMPVLAGRVLAVGEVDAIGILLAASILFWIPTHIMTFSMRYHEDYLAARIPTFPGVYGFSTTRIIIAVSSILAAVSMALASVWIGKTAGSLRLLIVLGSGLLFLALTTIFRPSERVNYGLFKYASFYMLSSMLLLAIPTL